MQNWFRVTASYHKVRFLKKSKSTQQIIESYFRHDQYCQMCTRNRNLGEHILINGWRPVFRVFFYWHGLVFIPAWNCDHKPSLLWGEMTTPFPNFKGCTFQICERTSHCMPRSLIHAEIKHYSDVIMGVMALKSPASPLFNQGADPRKHQSSASLASVRGIHRGPVNSPHKWPVTRKMLLFDDAIIGYVCTPHCIWLATLIHPKRQVGSLNGL